MKGGIPVSSGWLNGGLQCYQDSLGALLDSASGWTVVFFILFFFFNCILGFGVHVQNMQDSCTGTHVAVWFAVFLPFTHIWHFSPCSLSPTPLPYFAPTDPSVWCSPPCVHVFSLFITRLWVRICGISFSVLVSVCWEWYSPDSSMSLWRTRTHRFWLLHKYSMVYMCHIFPVQSIIDGHLGWFQVFAIVNSAAMNIHVHVSL